MNYGVYSNGTVLTDEDDKPLTNFAIRNPKMFYEAENEYSPGILRLSVVHRNETYQIDVDVQKSQLRQQIQQKIPTCKVLNSRYRNAIEAYILELPEAAGRPESPPLCFRQNGFHKLTDGSYVFVAGDEVLGLPQHRERTIAADVARAHLAWDPSLTSSQAVRDLLVVLGRNMEQLIPLWGFTLMSSMRSLLNSLNVTTFPSFAAIGAQGFGKTTMCQRFSLLYDDMQHPGRRWAEVDARSTVASTVDLVCRYRDQVLLVDDLAKSVSANQTRQREDLLADVLRFASNETCRSKMNPAKQTQERYCTAGLAFTGEFPLDNPSDITRTIAVQVDQQMQGGKQQDRVLAATAFRWFILWMLPQIDKTMEYMATALDNISGSNPRLEKNRVMLLWVLMKFLSFAQTTGAATEQEIDHFLPRVISVCDAILDHQIEQIAQLKTAGSLSWYILDGFQRGIIQRVTLTALKELKKKECLPEYYYVHLKKDDTFYATTKILYRYLTEQTPVHPASLKAMNKQLIAEGVIHPRKEGRSTTKKIHDRRYLELRRAELMSAAGMDAKTEPKKLSSKR